MPEIYKKPRSEDGSPRGKGIEMKIYHLDSRDYQELEDLLQLAKEQALAVNDTISTITILLDSIEPI